MGFYELLEITFQRERHGQGPIHWSAVLPGIVFEIYPAAAADQVDATTRLGFEVPLTPTLIDRLQASGVTFKQLPKDSLWGRRAIILDPDGRSVELLEVRADVTDATQTSEARLAAMIASVYKRPAMYVGGRTESQALECVLRYVHYEWAEAANRHDHLNLAHEELRERLNLNAMDFLSLHKSEYPSATPEEHFDFVLQCWKQISQRLGIDLDADLSRQQL